MAPADEGDDEPDVSQNSKQHTRGSPEPVPVAEKPTIEGIPTVGASFEASFLTQTQNLAKRNRKRRALDPGFVALDYSTDAS